MPSIVGIFFVFCDMGPNLAARVQVRAMKKFEMKSRDKIRKKICKTHTHSETRLPIKAARYAQICINHNSNSEHMALKVEDLLLLLLLLQFTDNIGTGIQF